MNELRVVRVHSKYRDLLWQLRLQPGVLLAEASADCWVRCRWNEETCRIVRGIPEAEVYCLNGGQVLHREGEILSCGVMPDLEFVPLAELSPQLPSTVWPVGRVPQVEISLVRCSRQRPPSLMLSDLSAWGRYAVTAPELRLKRWRFAVSQQDQVVVRGTPLPSLPGQSYYLDSDVAVPAGFRCEPDVGGAFVREIAGVAEGDVLLLTSDSGWHVISSGDWQPASRSAVRATLQASEATGQQQGPVP